MGAAKADPVPVAHSIPNILLLILELFNSASLVCNRTLRQGNRCFALDGSDESYFLASDATVLAKGRLRKKVTYAQLKPFMSYACVYVGLSRRPDLSLY